MADKKASGPCIDNETKEMLEAEVKKGRPRKFFLVYKGAQIKTLGVFRKGQFGSRVMQAKKEGFVGDVAYGIVNGSGKDLTFYIPGAKEIAEAMKADGHLEKAPIKDVKFKEFLKKEDLNFKPCFQIVTSISEIPQLDGQEEDEAPQEQTPPQETEGPTPKERERAFKQRLAELLPQIKQAAGTQPGDQAKQMASEAGAIAKNGQYDEAMQKLDEIEQLLSGQESPQAAEQEAAPQESAPEGPSPADKLTQALASLTPLIKETVAAAPERKNEILQPAADIKGLIAAGDFRNAATQIKEYQTFLRGIGSAQQAPSQDLLPVWRDAKDSVDQQLEQFRTALLKTGDDYLTKIAQGGVEPLLVGPGREYVALQAALMELQKATGETRSQAAQKLLGLVQSYKTYVEGNQFIDVCDKNRLCGPMTIRSTLSYALSELEKSAAALAA